MAHNRMDDFSVSVDPRTGELRSAGRRNGALGGLRRKPGGLDWRPFAAGGVLVLVLLLGVFAVALVSELV